MIVDETRKVHKSNHSQMFFKKDALSKNFAIFTGKCLESVFDKVAGLELYKKKRFHHRNLPTNIAKF